MLASLSEFKFFQTYRLPVEQVDEIRCLIEIEDELGKRTYIDDASLVDISLCGFGFKSKERLSLQTDLVISLQFRKKQISLEGTIVRSFVEAKSEDHEIIYGVELEQEKGLKRFLEYFIQSLPIDRLRGCILDLALKERYDKADDGLEIFSLLISLFKDITMFGNKEDFVDNMMEDVIRIMNAQRATVFLINPETNELEASSALGVKRDSLKFDYRLGIAGSVFTTGVALNIDTKKDETRFNKEFDEKFAFETRSIICHPIHNREDKIIGVIEVINKRNQDRFSVEDEKTMKVLSLIFSSVYHDYNPISEKSIVRNFSTPFDRPFVFVGRSAHINSIRKSIVKLKDLDSPLLITGEKGTGKILLGNVIHHEGKRGLAPCEVVFCEESDEQRIRKMILSKNPEDNILVKCQGGSVIFHEIGKLSRQLQEELNYVFEHKGLSGSSYSVDMRVIATTSQNLGEMYDNGKFSRGLYKFLTKSLLQLEPLRRRGLDDLNLLIDYFLKTECKKEGLLLKSFSEKAMKALLEYSWPGNVEELRHSIERAVLYNPKTHIISDIALKDEAAPLIDIYAERKLFQDIAYADDSKLPLKERMILIEREIILSEIKKVNGNKTKASSLMGISREALRKKLLAADEVLEKMGKNTKDQKIAA